MNWVANLAPAPIALGLLLLALALWLYFRSGATPAERERKRRLAVHSQGRVCGANVIDFRDDAVYYRYSIAGVEYTASQDLTSLRALLPPDPFVLIGPATLKYLPGNPANSIVICEEWSGLRVHPPQPGR
jgi:hypothetical protein